MGMTNDGRPLDFPDNPLTRIMTTPQPSQGSLAPTGPTYNFSAQSAPTVKSGAWGKMTEQEQQELDGKLAALMGSSEPAAAPARAVIPERIIPNPRKSRMNFNNIQRIDLEREVIVVDDMEFPLAPDDVKHLRLLCIDCVLNAVVQGLRDMLGQSGVEPSTVAGMLKEDVLGRRPEAPPLSGGHAVPGEGESPEDTMAP